MKVAELMSRPAHCCGLYDPLTEAARVLWDHDCGLVPVVEPVTNALLGVLTDRDICMAAYTRGLPLSAIAVDSVASTAVVTCFAHEDAAAVLERLKRHRLRRLVVVDEDGAVEGVVSLNDLARASQRAKGGARTALERELARTIAEVSRSHGDPAPAGGELKPLARKAPAPKSAAPAKVDRPSGAKARAKR